VDFLVQKERFEEEKKLYELMESPHDDPESQIEVAFSRTLKDDARDLPYRRSYGGLFFPLHLGQRKLLMSEIEFLTNHGEKSNLVVYAGAADGKHIPYLASLFPNHIFHLYDIGRYSPEVIQYAKRHHQLQVYSQLFSNSDAEKYAGKNTLFISDIRTVETVNGKKNPDLEQTVPRDMELQKEWFHIMTPAAALFKFRLPYMDPDTHEECYFEYLDGDLYLQPWAGATSSETRLCITSEKTKVYASRKYQNQMFRHNACTRVQWFKHDIPPKKVKGLDYCYDCTSEINILKNYLKIIQKVPEADLIAKIIYIMNNISIKIDRSINKPPHGFLPFIPFHQKRKRLQPYFAKNIQRSRSNPKN
jgi:cap2 methyltransferase